MYKLFLLLLFLCPLLLLLPPVFGRGSALLLLQGGPLLPLTVEKSLGYFVILSAVFFLCPCCRCLLSLVGGLPYCFCRVDLYCH